MGWRKRVGRLKPWSGTDGYTCPLFLSTCFFHCPCLSCSSPLTRVCRVKIVYLSLSCSLSILLSALWAISLLVSLSLSPSFSPHGSIQPPWLPPASLPQRLSPNPWKFGTNELTAEPLPRSLVPNYTVLHTRFPLQMAWCYSRHCGEHSSRTSTCPQMHTK